MIQTMQDDGSNYSINNYNTMRDIAAYLFLYALIYFHTNHNIFIF